MSRKISVTISETMYQWLTSESERTNVSMSEFARRAIERRCPAMAGRRTTGIEINVGVWRRRIFGRRSGIAFDP